VKLTVNQKTLFLFWLFIGIAAIFESAVRWQASVTTAGTARLAVSLETIDVKKRSNKNLKKR